MRGVLRDFFIIEKSSFIIEKTFFIIEKSVLEDSFCVNVLR